MGTTSKRWRHWMAYTGGQAKPRRTYRPLLETLEDRMAPASITIAPGDVVGLIQAIDYDNSNPSGGNSINLTPGSPYILTSVDNFWYGPNGLPAISSAVTINGNGAVIERAAGATPFRIFYVSGGFDTLAAGNLTLNNLTVAGGLAQGGNGGAGGGGGGAGLGGGIFNQGTLTLYGVTMTGNMAQGGEGNTTEVLGGGDDGGGGGLGGAGGSGDAAGDPGGGGGFATTGSPGTPEGGGSGGYFLGVDVESGRGGTTSGSGLGGNSLYGGRGAAGNSAGGGGGGGFAAIRRRRRCSGWRRRRPGLRQRRWRRRGT